MIPPDGRDMRYGITRGYLHSDFPLITAFKMQNPMVNTGRSIRKDRNPSATFASRISPVSHAHRAAVRASEIDRKLSFDAGDQ